MRKVLLLVVLLALVCNAKNVQKKKEETKTKNHERLYDVKPPEMSLLIGGGLRMAYPADDGVTLFAVHYSINKPVPGVAPGDYNFDVTSPTGGFFVHENTLVTVAIGDVVHYWIYIIYEGLGYQLLEQQWTAVEPTPPGPTTTLEPTESTTTESTTTSTTQSTASTTTTAYTGPPTSPTTPPPTVPECTEYPCLIFADEFDTLDTDTWEHEISMSGGGNWEFQYYTNNRSNSYTRDGNLFLKPTLTSDKYGEAFLSSGTLDLWGMAPPNYCTGESFYGCMRVGNGDNYINPIQSARLRSVRSFNFRYGKVEVEAQMPKGDWIWPAIWMLPQHEAYGTWPASGEIDLVEGRGNFDLTSGGVSKGHDNAGTTLHWGPFWPYNGYEKTTGEINKDFGDSMHRYGTEWDENSIRMLIDDQVIFETTPTNGGFWELGNFGLPDKSNPWRYSSKMAPFDQPFYFVMNVAVGGTNGFFPDEWTSNPPKPWSNQSPTAFRDFWVAKNSWYPTWNADVNNGEQAAMKVNYVRVWKLKAD